MPAPYGVVATGFSTKTLAEQLAELELTEQAAFGAGVIVDASSPLGQLNGLFADAMAEMWETAQAIYGSFDIDQATGTRLDALSKLRGIARLAGVSDAAFRQEIRQDTYGNIQSRKLRSTLQLVTGVTAVRIIENNTASTLANGLPSHSLAIAITGGTDADVATAIYDNTVPGIGLFGNTVITQTFDGFCRSIAFVRPDDVVLKITVDVFINVDRCECAPSSDDVIKQAIVDGLTGDCGVGPGTVVTRADVMQTINSEQGVLAVAARLARDTGTVADQDVTFTMFENPTIALTDINLNYVTTYV